MASNHSVRLFDSAATRAARVAAYIEEGLALGGNVLVVVTPENWKATAALLAHRGLPVDNRIESGQLTVLDAAQTLSRFMHGEVPDRDELESVLGTLISRLTERPGRLHIYGEMVDVLAEMGNFRGAHRLEELWNGLAAKMPFDLFCGYTSGHFGDERSAAALRAICDAHSHVHDDHDDILGTTLLERARNAGN